MVWQLLGAIAVDCSAHGHTDLVAVAHNRRRWFVAAQVVIWLASVSVSRFSYPGPAVVISLVSRDGDHSFPDLVIHSLGPAPTVWAVVSFFHFLI
jgi:hypothetical protein